MKVDDLVAALTVTAELIPARIADARIPPGKRGLYSIFIDDPKNLPAAFRRRLAASGTHLIYVGRASSSLSERLVDRDLHHKTASSFFRSLGAVLGFRPITGSLKGKKNTVNYKFSNTDTAKIVKWIDRHVMVRVVFYKGSSLEDDEKAIIGRLTPLLNIEDNPERLAELKELREECLRIARG